MCHSHARSAFCGAPRAGGSSPALLVRGWYSPFSDFRVSPLNFPASPSANSPRRTPACLLWPQPVVPQIFSVLLFLAKKRCHFFSAGHPDRARAVELGDRIPAREFPRRTPPLALTLRWPSSSSSSASSRRRARVNTRHDRDYIAKLDQNPTPKLIQCGPGSIYHSASRLDACARRVVSGTPACRERLALPSL